MEDKEIEEQIKQFVERQYWNTPSPKERMEKIKKRLLKFFKRFFISFFIFYFILALSFNYIYLNKYWDSKYSDLLLNSLSESYKFNEEFNNKLKDLPIVIRHIEKVSSKESDALSFNKDLNKEENKQEAIKEKTLWFIKLLFSKNSVSWNTAGSYISFKIFKPQSLWMDGFISLPLFKSFMNVYLEDANLNLKKDSEIKDNFYKEFEWKKEIVLHEYLHYFFDLLNKENPRFYKEFEHSLKTLTPETKNNLDNLTAPYFWIDSYSFVSEQFAYFWANVMKGDMNNFNSIINPSVSFYYSRIFKN